VSSLEFESELHYHSLTVFEDDVICAADSDNTDYGGSTVMLVKFNKFTRTISSATIIEDHLTLEPTILRVMHGGLQVSGQFLYDALVQFIRSTNLISDCERRILSHIDKSKFNCNFMVDLVRDLPRVGSGQSLLPFHYFESC